MHDLVKAGPHYLWLAAQRVGVLHLVAVAVRLADFRAGQQPAIAFSHCQLSGLAAQCLDARVERLVATERGVDRERTRYHRAGERIFDGEQSAERQRR